MSFIDPANDQGIKCEDYKRQAFEAMFFCPEFEPISVYLENESLARATDSYSRYPSHLILVVALNSGSESDRHLM